MLNTETAIQQAIKPKKPQKDQKNKQKKSLFWLVFVVILLSLGGSVLYDHFVKKDEGGEIVGISDKYHDRFKEDSAKLNRCVQYALVAGRNGWYARCGSEDKMYLYKGEIWKYGISCEETPENRYSQNFYTENTLQFLVEFRGTLLECAVEEKRKLYYYPVLPENAKRPESERLILPAGNCKRQ